MADSFKSVQHALNWKALQIKRMNKKQPVKQYSDTERAALAAQYGMQVSSKPPVPVKQRRAKVVEFVDDEIDMDQVPQELRESLGLAEEE